MNTRTMRILEWDKIKSRVQALAACSLGKARIEALAPLPTWDAANGELETVDEALSHVIRFGSLPYGGITDIAPAVQKAAIGGVLGPSELLRVADCIGGCRRVRQAIEAVQEQLPQPRIWARVQPLFDARQTESEIRQTIDDEGGVVDSASPELRRLRTERRQLEARVRQVLENMLRTHQKYLQDPVIAMRGSSFCLPIRVEYKNQVAGVVHDYSASGATVFVEPQAALEANLRVRELIVEEEREIERILQRVSGVVAGVAEGLLENVEILADVDAWHAKARYAKQDGCERPTLRRDGVWRLFQARHPLLEKHTAVPVGLELGSNFRLLIITGPNTGGKTVALKTLGLLTMLAMSGCFIPARATSEVGWCDDIYVDIGDEQSIEQSLSTFSSHMRNLVATLAEVTADSLVLLDELGAGTDPTEGAALAIAILDEFKYIGCRVMATTHYAELKGYAFNDAAATNASVEFDIETLRPTYRLQIGIPGKSNAIAIASRLGLHGSIVDRARTFVSHGDVRAEDLIGRLEEARRVADSARAEAETARREALRLQTDWEAKYRLLEANADRLKAAAAQEATRLVERTAQEAGRIIEDLRRMRTSGGAKDHELLALRKELEGLRPTSTKGGHRSSADGSAPAVSAGAVVKVLSLGQNGEVVEVDGPSVTVQLGLLRTKVALSEVEVIKHAAPRTTSVTTRRGLPKDIKLSLDIRGETVDDAIIQIDKYLDDAVVSGIPRVTIIHGKGTGALRDGVRRYLAHHPPAAAWVPGGLGEGGDGVTIVTIR